MSAFILVWIRKPADFNKHVLMGPKHNQVHFKHLGCVFLLKAGVVLNICILKKVVNVTPTCVWLVCSGSLIRIGVWQNCDHSKRVHWMSCNLVKRLGWMSIWSGWNQSQPGLEVGMSKHMVKRFLRVTTCSRRGVWLQPGQEVQMSDNTRRYLLQKGVTKKTWPPETLLCSKSKMLQPRKMKLYQPVYLTSSSSW